MTFVVHVAGYTLLFAAWGIAAGLVVRRLGLLCLATGAIAGTGAYAFALVRVPNSELLAWMAAIGAGALAGIVAVSLAGRIRHHDYALGTFAVMLAWESFVGSATSITGGPFGLPGTRPLPAADVIGSPLALTVGGILLVALAIAATSWERTRRIRIAASLLARSREMAEGFGVPTMLVLGGYGTAIGAVCGLGGAMLVAYLGFVGPTLITLSTSVLIAALALGFDRGPATFAVLLLAIVAVPEALRFVSLPGIDAPSLRIVLSGAVLIILALARRPAIAGISQEDTP